MTAEIAIVNRSAVTLAADSAVTLAMGGRRKVYTSTDKIFQLSSKDPIAIMLYNNLEFLGAPLEVLIRLFRTSEHCTRFKSVEDASVAFFDYLQTILKPTESLQNEHAYSLLLPEYRTLKREFDKRVRELFETKSEDDDGRDLADIPGQIVFLIKSVLEERIKELDGLDVAACFVGVSLEDMIATYSDVIDDLVNRVFTTFPLEESQKASLKQVGALALHRSTYSDDFTGFVFAGYGQEEVFPSLIAFHSDGVIANKFKMQEVERLHTSRGDLSAKIIPFAQREVVDRFLDGIDPELEESLNKYLRKVSGNTISKMFDGVTALSEADKETIKDNVSRALLSPIECLRDEWLDPAKESYRKETEDMVMFMAKQEAAQLAEALVNITSLKRKFSAGEETVAGPIDVAVISRSDGLIWVKRKHYFPAELNPRYFAQWHERHVLNIGRESNMGGQDA